MLVLPLHDPIQVAEEAAQVDVLSGGRLQFGVGRGYQSIEFDGFGVDLAEARERFDESLEVILGLWTQPRSRSRASTTRSTTSTWCRDRCNARIRRSTWPR